MRTPLPRELKTMVGTRIGAGATAAALEAQRKPRNPAHATGLM
jgi:hypothetical protein